MREKLFTLGLILVILGIMGAVPPGSALPPEMEYFPLYDEISDSRIGNIMIDPMNARYAIQADVGEHNGRLYYELKAYNPSGVPTTMIWGMGKANVFGRLRFHTTFDSVTLTWIQNYGLHGATYSVRRL